MPRNNGRLLACKFDDLFIDLSSMQHGPPPDLEGFIQGRPPAGELPAPSMSFLLIAVAHFLQAYGRLSAWLVENLQKMDESNREEDAPTVYIHKLLMEHENLLWAMDSYNKMPRALKQMTYCSIPDTYGVASANREELDTYPNSQAVCLLVAHNRGDALFGRLFRFSELGFGYEGHGRPEVPIQDLWKKLFGPSWRIPAMVIRELGDAGLLKILDDNDHFLPFPSTVHGLPVFRLGPAALPHAHLLDEFQRLWRDPAMRTWLAALIGDWEAARASALASGLDELAASMLPRVEQCRRGSRDAFLRRTRINEYRSIPEGTSPTPIAVHHEEMEELDLAWIVAEPHHELENISTRWDYTQEGD